MWGGKEPSITNQPLTQPSPQLVLAVSSGKSLGAMKVVTVNFMTCAVKGCKASPASFPLHFHDAELELQELDFQAEFIQNIVPRLDWNGLQVTANEVTFEMFCAITGIALRTDDASIAWFP